MIYKVSLRCPRCQKKGKRGYNLVLDQGTGIYLRCQHCHAVLRSTLLEGAYRRGFNDGARQRGAEIARLLGVIR